MRAVVTCDPGHPGGRCRFCHQSEQLVSVGERAPAGGEPVDPELALAEHGRPV